MRQPKPGDSPSGYDREIRPRKVVDDLTDHEREVRWRERRNNAAACASTDMRTADDWGDGFCD
jgi:hypothetical protein